MLSPRRSCQHAEQRQAQQQQRQTQQEQRQAQQQRQQGRQQPNHNEQRPGGGGGKSRSRLDTTLITEATLSQEGCLFNRQTSEKGS